ncbi:hypothetical protein JR316_0001656 [Psilocybe cubensis]|uniref:Uncharacterized protein n=2 Tax=Psilocybe cubensis TaxID=181762 RepID=A0ACB8HA63_PSICU|nr:hypothetical protein JR316_0001656 [Psilocybe cubensis]KAH9484756.1 hypothetical protein JR316_0001656 [Psilocybe cubensis]
MRFSTLAAFVAAAGVAQVAAVPIRVVIISKTTEANLDAPHAFPHPVPIPPNVATMVARPGMRHGCGGGRMGRFRQKGIEISNAFRQALGMPLIEMSTPPHHPQIKPGDSPTSVGMLQVLPNPILGSSEVPAPHRYHHPHHHVHGQMRIHGSSFSDRLVHSLMNLGRWEGRAVAFVLGCGIGVLLRMFWVLAVVLYRSVKGSNDDEHEYSHITVIEEFDEDAIMRSAPPTYTYPVDEKIAIENDAPKVASVDESK